MIGFMGTQINPSDSTWKIKKTFKFLTLILIPMKTNFNI